MIIFKMDFLSMSERTNEQIKNGESVECFYYDLNGAIVCVNFGTVKKALSFVDELYKSNDKTFIKLKDFKGIIIKEKESDLHCV